MATTNLNSGVRTLEANEREVIQQAISGWKPNASGGVKGDSGKVRPTILLKDLNKAVSSVMRVLEYGAKKYSRANYALVENDRYEDSIARHLMAHLSGELYDSETNEMHLTHLVCGALFLIEKHIQK